MLQGSFKGISRKIKGCLSEVLSEFQGFCQTLGLVLRLRVDFVLPLSQEQQEEQDLVFSVKLQLFL